MLTLWTPQATGNIGATQELKPNSGPWMYPTQGYTVMPLPIEFPQDRHMTFNDIAAIWPEPEHTA